MGAWGVAIFSDDLAADLRDEFRTLIGDGLSASEAVVKLLEEYGTELDDDETPVFWLSLAAIQWKLGHIDENTQRRALEVIDSGSDLERWDERDRVKRQQVLEKLREQLLSPAPSPKKVRRTIKATTDWQLGEVVAFRLQSENWCLLRVIGYHSDKGGRFAICELLDWVGTPVPNEAAIDELPVRYGKARQRVSQFLFSQPRKKADQTRLRRINVISRPEQKCGSYAALVWPYVDRLLKELYEFE